MVQWAASGHTGGVPELLEAEMYRRALDRVRGWTVEVVGGDDPLVVPEAESVRAVLVGSVVREVTRHGKVVLMHNGRATVALRFGMTGRLIVGDDDPIPALAYGPSKTSKAYDRWTMRLSGGPEPLTVRLSDPRRLARVVVDPDLSGLGPDAASVVPQALADRITRRRGPIKSVLMDQAVVAGLGNLLADEALWRAGIAPARPADRLANDEALRLAEVIPPMIDELLQRGGSHRGDLSVELRTPGARCPVDDTELVRRSIGGRTSWSCPHHQR